LSCHRLQQGLLVLVIFAMAGCAQLRRLETTPAQNAQLNATTPPQPKDLPEYWVMVGELAANRNDAALAAKAYQKAAEQSNDPAISERAVGLALMRGDVAGAIKGAQRWAALAPNDVEPQRALGMLYLQSKQNDKAFEAFAHIINQTPGGPAQGWQVIQDTVARINPVPTSMLNLIRKLRDQYADLAAAQACFAQVALNAGALDEALAAADRAQHLAPSAETIALKARILLAQGRSNDAVRLIAQAVEVQPSDVSLRLTYGQILIELQRFDAAQAQFQQLLKYDPGNAEALYALGLLAMDDGHLEEARDYFLQLAESGAHRDEAYYHLGVLESQQGRHKIALQWLAQVQSGQYLLPAQLQIAENLADLGDLETARSRLRELRDNNPPLALTLYLAEAELLLNHGQPQQAWDIYSEGLQKYPEDRRLRYGRAMAAEKLGRMQDAEADLRAVIKLHPNDADSLNALGYLLTINTSRYQEAKSLIEQALALEPDNAAIVDSMGWVNYKLGFYDQAETYLRRAYRLQDDPEVAAHLGEFLWTTNRRQEARKIWAEAQKAHPDNEILRNTMQRFGVP